MRIGLTGGASTPDKIIGQARRAEADGFHSLWFASVVQGDSLVAMALAGRETRAIELGTAVLQTYPCHPLLQAQRVAATVAAMGRPGLTVGLGPSHEANISGVYGLSYEHAGRNTEEYLQILTGLLRGEAVEVTGQDWATHAAAGTVRASHPVPVLLAALSPCMLRIAGEHAAGAILWMAPAAAIEKHAYPRISAAGRPAPRLVAGLLIVVHDDEQEARSAVAASSVMYASSPAYQRILAIGGADSPADAAIVGGEAAVTAQLEALLNAGPTDIHAHIVPAGDDNVRVAGRWTYLYRAIDQFGQVIDVLASEKRDLAAARRFFAKAPAHGRRPVAVTTDRAAAYPRVLDEQLPAAYHVDARYANNKVEADRGRLKARLRPMRGLKRLRSAQVIGSGHAFGQNLRRGHYELGVDAEPHHRLTAAFTELAQAI
nr:TIGR03564 family F420-dependent LLM class oxidoreductase [Pseudofrankia sp. BMG5.36]